MKTFEELKQMLKETENPLEKAVILTNIKAVLFSPEVIEKTIDIFNKYIGKQIGEKTKDKINEELKAIDPDLYFWFKSGLLHGIDEIELNNSKTQYIIDHNYRCVSISSNNRTPLFDENRRFKGIDKNDFYVWNAPKYFEDVKATAAEKQKQFDEVYKAIDKYNELKKVFESDNIIGLSHFEYLYKSPYRPTTFY